MRELFLKYFSRILAVLGCTTLVTACYGIPYDEFSAKVSGDVTDAVTGEPIKGVKVKVTVGNLSGNSTGDVKGIHVTDYSSPVEITTDARGRYSVHVYSHMDCNGVMVECTDVDGAENGSYRPASEVYRIADGAEVEADVVMDAE